MSVEDPKSPSKSGVNNALTKVGIGYIPGLLIAGLGVAGITATAIGINSANSVSVEEENLTDQQKSYQKTNKTLKIVLIILLILSIGAMAFGAFNIYATRRAGRLLTKNKAGAESSSA